jgi:hypothetical protein
MDSGSSPAKFITIGSRTLKVEATGRFESLLASAIAEEKLKKTQFESGYSQPSSNKNQPSNSSPHIHNASAAASAQIASANNNQGGTNQIAQIFSQAAQAGLLRINGNPKEVQQTAQMLTALAEKNPDVLQNLLEKFQSGQGFEINTQNSGGPKNANQGNSHVNAIGGNQITLDFGDASIGGQGGMLTVLAHELLHTDGATHGAAMDQATLQDVGNVLRGA